MHTEVQRLRESILNPLSSAVQEGVLDRRIFVHLEAWISDIFGILAAEGGDDLSDDAVETYAKTGASQIRAIEKYCARFIGLPAISKSDLESKLTEEARITAGLDQEVLDFALLEAADSHRVARTWVWMTQSEMLALLEPGFMRNILQPPRSALLLHEVGHLHPFAIELEDDSAAEESKQAELFCDFVGILLAGDEYLSAFSDYLEDLGSDYSKYRERHPCPAARSSFIVGGAIQWARDCGLRLAEPPGLIVSAAAGRLPSEDEIVLSKIFTRKSKLQEHARNLIHTRREKAAGPEPASSGGEE